MQFTTSLVSILLAVSGAQALPGSSSVEARQERRVVHARFFDDTGCNGNLIGQQDFVQGAQPSCVPINTPGVHCTLITSNNATQTRKLFPMHRTEVLEEVKENKSTHEYSSGVLQPRGLQPRRLPVVHGWPWRYPAALRSGRRCGPVRFLGSCGSFS